MKKQVFPLTAPGKLYFLHQNAGVVASTERCFESNSKLEGGKVEAVELVGPSIFLLEEGKMSEEQAFARVLQGHWSMIAMEQLGGWPLDTDAWPQIHGLPEFLESFQCTGADTVHDLQSKRLEREALKVL